MRSTGIVVVPEFRPGSRPHETGVRRVGRAEPRGRRAGWTQVLLSRLRAHGTGDIGRPEDGPVAPPRHHLPIPFC